MPRPIPKRTVKTTHRVVDLADDLSSITLEHEEAVPARGRRTRRRVGKVFVMMDAPALGQLRLSLVEYRVMMAVLALTGKESGEAVAPHGLIARTAGVSQGRESVAMKALVARNIVLKLPYSTWRVNRYIAFVGEWKDWDALARKDGEPLWEPEDLIVEERPALVAVE